MGFDLKSDIHQSFLSSLRGRKGTGQIALAAPAVSRALACVGPHCARYMGGVDIGSAAKGAEDLTTYSGSGFNLETKETSAANFKLLLPEGIDPPKHTAMILRHVVTTPREDRDHDVLRTDGAQIDPKSPLLWQHIPALPIGKLVTVVDHTPEVLRVATALLDLNDLTADAVKLIEADALRFSHGFRVLEFRERKASGEFVGFEVTKFEILEKSLVSVPSNVDAVIEMYAKGHLGSEPMKRFAKGLADERPVVVAGVDIPTKEADEEEAAVEQPTLAAAEEPEVKCSCATELKGVADLPVFDAQRNASPDVDFVACKLIPVPHIGDPLTPEIWREIHEAIEGKRVRRINDGLLLILEEPPPHAPAQEEKAGRVLSSRNVNRVKEVQANLQEIHDYEGLPRPCKAMCKDSMKLLDEVMAEAEPEEEEKSAEPAAKTPDQQFADAMAAAGIDTLRRYHDAIESAIRADELNQLTEQLFS